MARSPRHRVLMIAVDAGELSFIRASLPHLPTFRRLLEEGALLPLRSSAEHISASVWPTMYTGQSVGDHGISMHIQWDPDRMRMRRISSAWVYNEPFWYDLARAGRGVTVLDVPFTFENRLPQAVEVTNWGSHDLMGAFQTNPPDLRQEIRRRFGRHPMGYEIPVSKDTRQLAAMRRECVEGAESKGRLARWLRDTTDWDFYLAVFGECHRAGHILWRDHDEPHAHVPPGALLDVYRAVDRGVGTALEGADLETATVVVFALHGMGANFSQEHFVRRTMDRVNASFRHEGPAREDPPGRQRGLIRALRESIPAPLQHAIARSVPVQVRDWVVGREVTGGLDWTRTPGFALRSDLFSFVRLNVAGRERLGTLQAGSDTYRRYVEHVTRSFLGLRTVGTDRPVIRDIAVAPDIFSGARQQLLPDLILRWAEEKPATELRSPELGLIRAAPDSGRTGEHRPGGFALVLGRGVKEGGLPPLAHNRDFPRFVSHLLGVRTGS
ncbi:MAG TPA: alkaline phosphatase family protein [Methylomirabilota bacterium]|nr:alkaline phosphatase family protein [Methylomirabilota bacterium]